jgi:hypothetical protein
MSRRTASQLLPRSYALTRARLRGNCFGLSLLSCGMSGLISLRPENDVDAFRVKRTNPAIDV